MIEKNLRLSLALGALTLAAASAGLADRQDGTGAGAPEVDRVARGGTVPTWFVPYFRSMSGSVLTAVTLTNTGSTSCSVAVDFYFAFNSDPIPECTLENTLGPLFPAGAQRSTLSVCTRPLESGDSWTLCSSSCSPALANHEGKAVVRVDPSCGTQVVADVRILKTASSDEVLEAARAARPVPLR